MNGNELYKQAADGKITDIILPDPDNLPDGIQIIEGDFRQVEIPEADCIFTELHPKQVALCSDMARIATEKVKSGGLVAVMCSPGNMFEVHRLLSERLTYHWTIAYRSSRGENLQVSSRQVRTLWKPVLVFSVGAYDGKMIYDLQDSGKGFTDYGQTVAGMSEIVKQISKEGDTILDPMAAGGTIGVSAIKLLRKFVGITGKWDAVEARRRLCLS